jgi:Bifunctional DNA primase/polymerase, N-terminal
MNTTSNGKISHLLELLGPVVLLPWPSGSKGHRRKWKHLQLTDMDADYFATLQKAGNIGVALGAVSNGLVTIDIDDYRHVEPFLEANPLLRHTLRTAAQRGCNFWLRCTSDYPSSCKLKDQSGKEIGEWRADGNQTIIAGTHPTGVPYCFVIEKPVITVDYKDIIWPDGILPPHATENKRVRGVRRIREKEVVCIRGDCLQIQAFFGSNDLIAQVAPTDYHQNNPSLFKLARLIKSYENAVGRAATDEELEAVFDRWSVIARRFWRHSRDEYYAEFLDACSYARIGLHENPIEVAVSRAKRAPLPEVRGFTDERIRLLVAICREMQQITAANPFFLPTRKLGEILGIHYTLVARWLRALEFLQIICLAPGEVRRRGGSRSPRYHYGSPKRNTVGFVVTAPLPPTELIALTEGGQSNAMEGVTRRDVEMLRPLTTAAVIDVDSSFQSKP